MSSQAEKKRRKRAVTASRADENRARAETGARGSARVVSIDTAKNYRRHQSGLEYLKARGKITDRQSRIGEEYGRTYREASIEGEAAIKSSLAEPEKVGGGHGGLPATALVATHLVVAAREKLCEARSILGHSAGLIGSCDTVCGKQMTPREIVGGEQRDAEQIETALRLALDMLIDHGWGSAS